MRKLLFLFTLLVTCSMKAQSLNELYQKTNPAVVVILTEQKELVSNGKMTKAVTADVASFWPLA